MENLIKIDTVDQYNKMFGLETLHPLVSVVDLSKSETWPTNFRVNYIRTFPERYEMRGYSVWEAIL